MPREQNDSPLALTDDELGKVYKAVLAADIRGGVTVEPSGLVGAGWDVVAPALRARAGFVIATARRRGAADIIMHAFNYLAFLIESLQSERAAHDRLQHEMGCVIDTLDALSVPTIHPDGSGELSGQPYLLHERVGLLHDRSSSEG